MGRKLIAIDASRCCVNDFDTQRAARLGAGQQLHFSDASVNSS